MNDSELWTQISQYIGLPGKTPEQILGALNAAGQSAGVRTLLCINAINEGVGSRYWRNQLANLSSKLKDYKYIACVISCRSEYFELAVPGSIAKNHPIFDVRGFVTPEEQLNAARVYLDRRGIVRCPWFVRHLATSTLFVVQNLSVTIIRCYHALFLDCKTFRYSRRCLDERPGGCCCLQAAIISQMPVFCSRLVWIAAHNANETLLRSASPRPARNTLSPSPRSINSPSLPPWLALLAAA